MKTNFFKCKSGYLLIVVIFVLFAATNTVFAEYSAMQGADQSDTVFDFRIEDPAIALRHLNLIHTMKDDPNMRVNGNRPEIVVVFIGPSVKLVSTDRAGFDEQKRKNFEKVAEKIASMDKDGVRFEICMRAASANGVAPDKIMPEIEKVENGWISLVGYQNKGFAVISDF